MSSPGNEDERIRRGRSIDRALAQAPLYLIRFCAGYVLFAFIMMIYAAKSYPEAGGAIFFGVTIIIYGGAALAAAILIRAGAVLIGIILNRKPGITLKPFGRLLAIPVAALLGVILFHLFLPEAGASRYQLRVIETGLFLGLSILGVILYAKFPEPGGQSLGVTSLGVRL